MSKKNYLILGVGGHGWQSLQDFIEKSTENLILYTTAADWGGFTGAFGRLLEENNGKLNQKLHKEILPILPWGDLNKILIHFFDQKFQENTENILDFRSFNLTEQLSTFQKLANYLSLKEDFKIEFEEYLSIFFDEINGSKKNLSTFSRPPCLGGLWQNFLYWKAGGINGWNNFYHQKGIVPANINLFFTSTQREILVGKDEFKNKLVGEDEIDTQLSPVLPETLNLLSKSNFETIENPRLISDLKNADLIIIPNGSVANWLPLCNQKNIQKILKLKSEKKQLCWLLNLFHTKNELKITRYIEYIYSLNIYPTILAPIDLPEKPPTSIISRYEEEGKYLNLDSFEVVEKLKNISKDLHFSLECNLGQSFKYDPEIVNTTIRKIWN